MFETLASFFLVVVFQSLFLFSSGSVVWRRSGTLHGAEQPSEVTRPFADRVAGEPVIKLPYPCRDLPLRSSAPS